MSLRVAREAPKEVVVRCRGRRVHVGAAEFVGAEVARSSRALEVARDAGVGVAERDCGQRQLLEGAHGGGLFAPTRLFRGLLLGERGADSDVI